MTVATVARTASHGVILTVERFDQRGGFPFQERQASRVRSRVVRPARLAGRKVVGDGQPAGATL